MAVFLYRVWSRLVVMGIDLVEILPRRSAGSSNNLRNRTYKPAVTFAASSTGHAILFDHSTSDPANGGVFLLRLDSLDVLVLDAALFPT